MAPVTLHALPSSHPCMVAEAALQLRGIEYERIDLVPGAHGDDVERIYGEGCRTVPGVLFEDGPVHGSRAILAHLDEGDLFPADRADAVRAAEHWGDEELQDVARRLVFGALHFRPEAMGTFAGGAPLDPAGTDFAIGYLRQAWRYRDITAVQLAEDLRALPGILDRVDALAADDIVDGEHPTAADLQIGASLRLLLTIGDVRGLLEGRTSERIARRWFPDYAGDVPAGAFPAGWVPSA